MALIQLKTQLPGPKSQALMVERQRYVARGPFHTTPIFIEKAKGAVLEDVDGNRLIDFGSGIAVVNVGHSAEPLIFAIQEQASKFLHTSFNITPYENYVKVAQALTEITPGRFSKKVFLANSGAEAVENAIKIARFATNRQAVICFDHAFHGRTYMAMSLTAKTKPYRYGFAPFNPEIYRAPFPYLYRWPDATDPEVVSSECFDRFKDLANYQIGADKIAAVIIEPVLGEGGFVPAPVSFMKRLREFCNQNGIVLIADEVQTGFGRTGAMFACEHYGIEADIMTLAKGMAGGMPLSAVVGKTEIMDAVPDGGIGGTYGGNPLACASALAVFETFKDGSLLSRAKAIGETLQSRLKEWKEKFPIIGDVRGLGPMLGIELVKNRMSKEPAPETTKQLSKYCYEHGVVLLTAGTYGNVIRFLPPLVIGVQELQEGLAVVENGLKELRV